MSEYTAIALRALATIRRKGGPVSFPSGTAPAYDADTDSWSPDLRTVATGSAVQIDGDPDRLAVLSLVVVNPVTLLIAAEGWTTAAGASVAFTPIMPTTMTWAGEVYAVKDIDPIAPNGRAIAWTVVGSK
jgi:hypothetical protein